jgi:hypothetical protein
MYIPAQTFWPSRLIPAVNLRQPCNARSNRVSAALLSRVVRKILDEERARPNEAHLASQYTPKLGEFIQAGGAKQLPEPSYSQFIRQQLAVGVMRIGHSAELQHSEDPLIQTWSRLDEQNGRADYDTHNNRNQRNDWPQQQQRETAHDDIQHTLAPFGVPFAIGTGPNLNHEWGASRGHWRDGRTAAS